MKITAITLKKNVGTFLLVLLSAILGFLAIKGMPVSFWPEFTAPTLIVLAPYPGASPEEVEEQIARPLEQQLSTIEGIDEIETSCFEGVCRIFARFDWGEDFKQAKLDVQDRVNKARAFFPRGAREPQVLQVQDFLPPGIELGFYSDSRTLNEIREFLDKKVTGRLLLLNNVATVQLFGGAEEELLVQLDEKKLRKYNIAPEQVVRYLQGLNQDQSVGYIKGNHYQYIIRLKSQVESPIDLSDRIIARLSDNTLLRLQDIGTVEIHEKEKESVVRLNGREIIGLSIREKSGGNTVAMVDEVRATLPWIREILPDDVQMEVIRDQSEFIRLSIQNVIKNAFLGALLAAMIIFLFLGNLRNTLIIITSIPLSIILSFIFMKEFGLTLNIISLGGLALAVGMIVDASVVVLENIFRHLSERPGEKNKELVVLEATEEVGSAIFSATLTSVVVFLPLAFLVGLFSVLLGELALTVVFSLSISILVAVTVVPLLSVKWMKVDRSKNILARSWDGALGWIKCRYAGWMADILRKPIRFLLIATLGALGLIAVLVSGIDVELMPTINQGEFRIEFTGPEGIQLKVTDEVCQTVERELRKDPSIEQIYSQVGVLSARGELKTNVATITANVKKEKIALLNSLMEELRSKWAHAFPGFRIVIRQADVTEGMSRAPVNIRLLGDNLEALHSLGLIIIQKLESYPGIVNVSMTSREKLPEFRIRINEKRCWVHGLTPPQLASMLKVLLQGNSDNRYRVFGEEYDITIRMEGADTLQWNDIRSVSVPCPDGAIVPLNYLITYERAEAPSEIHRLNQQRMIEITADVQGISRRHGRAVATGIMSEMELPPDVLVAYGGESKSIRDSFTSLSIALLIALILVYVVMGTQFNSYRQPFIIGFTIPLAIVGVILGLRIFGAPFSMNAFLGFIMLVGIVVNNGILLIDFANRRIMEGSAIVDALISAGQIRLRPILMTSMTTIVGMLPLAIGLGEGGEALKPLGAVVAGGLATSTVLTLFILPAIYYLMEKPEKCL